MSNVTKKTRGLILVSSILLILMSMIIGCSTGCPSRCLTGLGEMQNLNSAGTEPAEINWLVLSNSGIRNECIDWQKFYDDNRHEYVVNGLIDLELLKDFTIKNVGDFYYFNFDFDPQGASEGSRIKVKDSKVTIKITVS